MAHPLPLTDEQWSDFLEDVAVHGVVRREIRRWDLDVRHFMRWVNRSEERRSQLWFAKVMGADGMADETIELADTARRVTYRERTRNKDGTVTTKTRIEDNTERTRLQINT